MHNNKSTYSQIPSKQYLFTNKHARKLEVSQQLKNTHFNHALKFRQLQEIKANNIDQLNLKIINLINKLSIENQSKSQYIHVQQHKKGKERLKTDYGYYGAEDQGTEYQENQTKANKNIKEYNKYKMASEGHTSQNQNLYKQKNIQYIRKKYKENDGKMLKKNISASILSNFNSTADIHFSSKIDNPTFNKNKLDDDINSFKQKLKDINNKQYKLKINEPKIQNNKAKLKTQISSFNTFNAFNTFNPAFQNQNNNDRIVNNFQAYQKKIINYNLNKSDLFSNNQLTVERTPLKDQTNQHHNLNTNHHFSQLDSSSMFKKNVNNYHAKVGQFQAAKNNDKNFNQRFFEGQTKSKAVKQSAIYNDKQCKLLKDLMEGFKSKLHQANSTPYSSKNCITHQNFNESQSSQSLMLKSLINAIEKSSQTFNQSSLNDMQPLYNNDMDQPLTADFRQNNELQHLILNLKQQIKLDAVFRNAKKWFQRCQYKNKWQELLSIAISKDLNFIESQIHQIFTLRQQQENPFYTYKQSQFSISQLVDTFLQCQQHWFQCIIKSYKYNLLINCGFTNTRLDRLQKGYVEISDLVRFMNTQSRQIYHSRDMILIFERLKSEEKLTFEDLIQIICQ